jgi:hypothetical protein
MGRGKGKGASYLTEYFRGEHTRNELKALILYGSTETRHLTKSEA